MRLGSFCIGRYNTQASLRSETATTHHQKMSTIYVDAIIVLGSITVVAATGYLGYIFRKEVVGAYRKVRDWLGRGFHREPLSEDAELGMLTSLANYGYISAPRPPPAAHVGGSRASRS